MIKKTLSIIIGSILIAIGVNYFLIPSHLLDGGIIGLGLIAKYTLGIKPGLTIILLSLPLYFAAWFYHRTYFYNGLHGLFVTSFLIDYLYPLSTWQTTPILISSLAGGLLIGIGMSILLLTNVSTDGADLLALMLSRVTTLNVGIYIFLIDSLVILFGSFVIQQSTIVYSAIMVFIIVLTTYFLTSYFANIEKSS